MNMRDWYKKNRALGPFQNAKSVRRLKEVQHSINARAAWSETISRMSEDDSIGIFWEGMDCDCVRFSYARTVSNQLMNLFKYINAAYDDAEGPLSWYFIPTREAKRIKRSSRDLALEAFEEGHSHVVYY